jgi:hypothetical protein
MTTTSAVARSPQLQLRNQRIIDVPYGQRFRHESPLRMQ